jgi:hypothetical protein
MPTNLKSWIETQKNDSAPRVYLHFCQFHLEGHIYVPIIKTDTPKFNGFVTQVLPRNRDSTVQGHSTAYTFQLANYSEFFRLTITPKAKLDRVRAFKTSGLYMENNPSKLSPHNQKVLEHLINPVHA